MLDVGDEDILPTPLLSTVVTGMKNTELAGTAPHGKVALSKISLSPPDLVLLDVTMPVMDGIETLKQIRKNYPDIDVIMVSGSDSGIANLTMKALNLGALDFIPKPEGTSPDESMKSLKTSLNPLISLVRTRKLSRLTKRISAAEIEYAAPVISKPPPGRKPPPEKRIPAEPLSVPGIKRKAGKIDVIGLGVSTGGPNALQEVIPKLAGKLRVPVLAVQHMPPAFTASLAERLDKESAISVKECGDGDTVENGMMFIAPGGSHMVVRKGVSDKHTLRVVDSPPVNSCKPSVDVLLRSMGMVYGGNILTVILTGMGNDGAVGVASIRRRGGVFYCSG